MWTHCGVYFTPVHISEAQRWREREPKRSAWQMLEQREVTGSDAALWGALRWRFDAQRGAGEAAAAALVAGLHAELNPDQTWLDAVRETLVLMQAFELLRDTAAISSLDQARALDGVWERVSALNGEQYALSYVEGLWRALLNVVGGVVLEREHVLRQGTSVYEATVANDIHPHGYITPVVSEGDGGGLLRQLLCVSALALMAEAASHIGIDLWAFNVRGVSVATAYAYLPYYYFFPDRWRWDKQASSAPYTTYGGFFEIVQRRFPLRDVEPLLAALRPIVDLPGGGLTTLTHAAVRRGLLG